MSSTLLPDPSELEAEPPVPVETGRGALSGAAASVAEVASQQVVSQAASQVASVGSAPSGTVTRHLVSGTSALGLGTIIERGTGFLANILAARLGGVGTFGAYSLAITTANNIGTYAAAGIGSTSARFSGKYQYGTASYGTLARVLAIVSFVSAAAAAFALWLGAAPIARLLHKESLSPLLAWAALSAAGMVMLECARGFFVGQRRLAALVLLSVIVGAGMLSLIPLSAAHHNPVHMVVSQALITMTAVAVCLLLARPLGLFSPKSDTPPSPHPFVPMLREVWGFGFVQLAGLVGANLAGWWLTMLVARGDSTLGQMSFFSIASQLRNIVGLAPGLLTEGSFAIMADPDGERSRTPQHVLGLTTFLSSLAAMVLASAGILFAPWLLGLLYKSAYRNAAVTVSVALALAVMHMGNAPASARLSIVSIRTSGVINSAWAIFVVAAGTLLMLGGGSAATAMTIYLAAHTLSSFLVLGVLARRDSLPRGMVAAFSLATGTTAALAGLATLRARNPEQTLSLTLGMAALAIASLLALLALGRVHRWLPTRAALERLLHALGGSLSGLLRRRRQHEL